jgi:hypothetical protein
VRRGSIVDVQPLATGLLLRAGAQPEQCDLNRLKLAPSYVQADEMIRPIRAASGLDFKDPWDGASTERWLRRFEKRVY